MSRKLTMEAKMLVGAMVLVPAIGILAVIWVVVIFGSGFFGPKAG